MKLRSGFVANSSTSSFVLFGFAVTTEEATAMLGSDDEWGERAEELDLELVEGDDELLVGKLIAKSFDDGAGTWTELILPDLGVLTKQLQRHLRTRKEPKLYAGVMVT